MALTREQSIQLYGTEAYTAWPESAAAADAAAHPEKLGTSSSYGSGYSMPSFTFDDALAEKQALDELRPYYETLLKQSNGNVQLAIQRMQQDYDRGLRYKATTTGNSLSDIASERADRARRFKIAMGDLGEEFNRRGLYNSGLRETGEQTAIANEASATGQLDQRVRDINLSNDQYTEEQNLQKGRTLEDLGVNKPVGVPDFVSKPDQEKFNLSQEKATRAISMAQQRRAQAFTEWANNAARMVR